MSTKPKALLGARQKVAMPQKSLKSIRVRLTEIELFLGELDTMLSGRTDSESLELFSRVQDFASHFLTSTKAFDELFHRG